MCTRGTVTQATAHNCPSATLYLGPHLQSGNAWDDLRCRSQVWHHHGCHPVTTWPSVGVSFRQTPHWREHYYASDRSAAYHGRNRILPHRRNVSAVWPIMSRSRPVVFVRVVYRRTSLLVEPQSVAERGFIAGRRTEVSCCMSPCGQESKGG